MQPIARVIPAVGLPRSLTVFDYAISENLGRDIVPGSIVRVPFRNRPILGLVDSIQDGDASSLKSVIEIPTSFRFSHGDRCVVDWISANACVSPALVFSRMVPFIPFLKSELAEQSLAEKPPRQPVLARSATISERDGIIFDAINSTDEGVALLLCPTVREAERMMGTLSARIGADEITLITSATRITALRTACARIAEGRVRIAVGTRLLLTVPLGSRRLSAIILCDASRDEHKQADLNPRYDGRGLAVHRAAIAGAACTLVSSAPRLEDVLAVREHLFTQRPQRMDRQAPYTITDLSDAMRGGRYDFLTDELENAIRECCDQKKSVFLFLNRKGSSRLVSCKDCEYLFACTECRHPYSFFKADSTLRCSSGHRTLPLPATCPSCRGARFSFRGFGIEKLCDSLIKLFPGVPVAEYSREMRSSTQKAAPHIVVGTSLVPIECPEIIQNAGLVGIVTADPIINPHDFRSVEHQWRQIADILSYATGRDARVVIQAFRPSDSFVQTLARGDFESFADVLMREREAYRWPPFSRLVTVIVKKTQGREKAVRTQLDVLKTRLESLGSDVSVFAPTQEKKQIRMSVRITGARPYSEPFPSRLAPIFASLPADWLVDTDPLVL